MENLDLIKVPIFEGINDLPRPPIEELAGNGADLINRFNLLVEEVKQIPRQEVFSPPTETWESFKNFYVNTNFGSDLNSGESAQSELKTLAAAIEVISSKKIERVFINVSGTLTEQLDLSKLYSNNSALLLSNKSSLEIKGLGSGRFSWEFSGEIFKNSFDSELKIIVSRCDFIAEESSIILKNLVCPIQLDGCSFDSGTANQSTNLVLVNNNFISINAWENLETFKNSGGNCWGNLEIIDSSKLINLNGYPYFSGANYGVTLYQGGKLKFNSYENEAFEQSSSVVNFYLEDKSQLFLENFKLFIPNKIYSDDSLIYFKGKPISNQKTNLFFPSVDNQEILLLPFTNQETYLISLTWLCDNPSGLAFELFYQDVTPNNTNEPVSCDQSELLENANFRKLTFPQNNSIPTHLIPSSSALFATVLGTTTNLYLQLDYWS